MTRGLLEDPRNGLFPLDYVLGRYLLLDLADIHSSPSYDGGTPPVCPACADTG